MPWFDNCVVATWITKTENDVSWVIMMSLLPNGVTQTEWDVLA